MATTFTGFEDTKVIQNGIAALKYGLIAVDAISFGVDMGRNGQGAYVGDVISVPLWTAQTAGSRTPGSDGTPGGGGTVVSLTCPATTVYAQWTATDGKDKPGMFESGAVEAGYAVAYAVLNTVMAEVTATNYGNTDADKLQCAIGDWNQVQLGYLLDKAITKKLSERSRSLVLNGSYASRLTTDGALALIMATRGNDSINTGKLPPLLGMNTFMYGGLPTNSENLVGFVCDKGAIAAGIAPVASVVSAGQGDLIANEIITDPDSKVAMSYRRWYNSGTGVMSGRFECFVDATKGTNSLVRLVSA